jgi:hypothetical protein
MKLVSVVLAISYIGTASAWWNQPHFITAKIAEDILSEESPEVLEWANEMLKELQLSKPDMTIREKYHAFVECSTWGDDVKYSAAPYQANWHFLDFPFLDQGGSIEDFNYTPNKYNITAAMYAISSMMKKDP